MTGLEFAGVAAAAAVMLFIAMPLGFMVLVYAVRGILYIAGITSGQNKKMFQSPKNVL